MVMFRENDFYCRCTAAVVRLELLTYGFSLLACLNIADCNVMATTTKAYLAKATAISCTR